MQCERLIRLTKQWYLHVKEETMAPARMVQFIEEHVETCAVCRADPGLQGEIEKITAIVLPESKIPKAVRMKQEAEQAARDEADEANRIPAGQVSPADGGEEFREDDNEAPLSTSNDIV